MLNRNKTAVFVAFFVLLLASIYFYRTTIFFPPSYIHAWTQSDRYAIAIGFTENGLNLFKPQSYNLQTLEGVTAVDFPLPDYLSAIVMKISDNTHPAIFRSVMLLLCLSGCLLFIQFVSAISKSVWKGVSMGLFVFSLPVMVYFQAGFIPSALALYLSLGGLYFYYQHLHNNQTASLASALALFTLAALIRAPFFLFLLGLIGAHTIYTLRNKVFNLRDILLYTLSIAVVLGYFFYNQHLRAKHGTMFLTHFMPAGSLHSLKDLIKLVWERWHYQYFTLAHYLFIAVITIDFLIGFMWKQIQLSKADKHLFFVTLVFSVMATAYALLMAKQFVDHEYYFIDSFYLPIVLLTALFLAKTKYTKGTVPMAILFTALLLTGCHQSKQVQKVKYAETDWDIGEVARKNFTGADIFLDSAGIPRSAKLLIIDAYSTNAPLILSGRKGYTVLNTYYNSIDSAMTLPYDYILIQDRSILADVLNYYPPFACKAKRIAGNGKISVFVRKDTDPCSTFWEIAGLNKEQVIDSSSACQGYRWENNLPDSNCINNILPKTKYASTFLTRYNDSFNAIVFTATFGSKAKAQPAIVLQIETNGFNYYKEHPMLIRPEIGYEQKHFLLKLPQNVPRNATVKCFIINKLDQHFTYKNATVYLLNQ